jgi:hypothetical protein
LILLVWVFLLVIWNDTLSGISIWCSCPFNYIALRIGLLWINSSHFALGNWWLIWKSLLIFFILKLFLLLFDAFLSYCTSRLFSKKWRGCFIYLLLILIGILTILRNNWVFNGRFSIICCSRTSSQSLARSIWLSIIPSLSL